MVRSSSATSSPFAARSSGVGIGAPVGSGSWSSRLSTGARCRRRCRSRPRASFTPMRTSQVENLAPPANCSRCVKASRYACCITSSTSDSSRSTARMARYSRRLFRRMRTSNSGVFP